MHSTRPAGAETTIEVYPIEPYSQQTLALLDLVDEKRLERIFLITRCQSIFLSIPDPDNLSALNQNVPPFVAFGEKSANLAAIGFPLLGKRVAGA
jgi:hypothetical protein